jgi:hypothetical protein
MLFARRPLAPVSTSWPDTLYGAYAQKRWTNFEREAAQARAFAESREYILPARFDDTELPGMLPATGYVSVRERAPEELVRLILKKLETSEL